VAPSVRNKPYNKGMARGLGRRRSLPGPFNIKIRSYPGQNNRRMKRKRMRRKRKKRKRKKITKARRIISSSKSLCFATKF
jgi:hypothetical protein